MQDNYLHIVSFDIVYPANYGGAIDVFYRIKALHQDGVKIILHCTYKGKLQHYSELESLCEKVYYYKRNMSMFRQLSILPYAVLTRANNELLDNLIADNHPILFEGLVTCYFFNHPLLANRKKFFRECNVEHDYYLQLAQATRSFSKKVYYSIEARKLRRFEKTISQADVIFALSHADERHFQLAYPNTKVVYVPCFHANEHVDIAVGSGEYILYHGNLNVPENDLAAQYICSEIVPLLGDIEVIIAGHNPSKRLEKMVSNLPKVHLVADPTQYELDQLVRNAHIHLLITHQATGLKLKLLNVLYQGRYVVVNSKMVEGTELKQLCIIEDNPEQMAMRCRQLMSQQFDRQQAVEREQVLLKYFDNSILCKNIMSNL